MTKGDLLEPVLLASAIETIEKDIKDMFTEILNHSKNYSQPLNKNHNPNKLEEKQNIKLLQLKSLESLLLTDIKSEVISYSSSFNLSFDVINMILDDISCKFFIRCRFGSFMETIKEMG